MIEGLEPGEVADEVSLSFKSISYASPNAPGPGKVTFTLRSPGKQDQTIKFDYSV